MFMGRGGLGPNKNQKAHGPWPYTMETYKYIRNTYNAEPAATTAANQPQKPAPAVDYDVLADCSSIFEENKGALVKGASFDTLPK